MSLFSPPPRGHIFSHRGFVNISNREILSSKSPIFQTLFMFASMNLYNIKTDFISVSILKSSKSRRVSF